MAVIARRTAIAGVSTSAVLAGCTSAGEQPDSSGSDGPDENATGTAAPSEGEREGHAVAAQSELASLVLPQGDDPTNAVSASLLAEATAVVVVREPEQADAVAGLATQLGLPVLWEGENLLEELDRLGASTVVAIDADGLEAGEREVVGEESAGDIEGLPLEPEASEVIALRVEGEEVSEATAATLASLGIEISDVTFSDPRASAESVALMKQAGAAVIGLGGAFGESERFAARVEAARTLEELPGGGVAPFPGRMMIALYGHPSGSALGMLGEQGPEESVARVQEYVEQYQAESDIPVIGAFEIIATIASSSAGADGDYSAETSVEELLPLIEAAEAQGVYCVLDLQPGYTDFLTQAQLYEELLKRPTVGLALDPEWRLQPGQRHMTVIGQVDVDEVNATGEWLADLVAENELPPKVLILHQFQTRMITGRERLDTSRDEVQYLIHADGHGNHGMKQETWRALKVGLPDDVWLGWKNFYDEDSPMMTPQETMHEVEPRPNFVSYQ